MQNNFIHFTIKSSRVVGLWESEADREFQLIKLLGVIRSFRYNLNYEMFSSLHECVWKPRIASGGTILAIS